MNNKISHRKYTIVERIMRYFERIIILEKLNNWLGYLVFFGLALFFGYSMVYKPMMGLGLVGFLAAFSVVLVCLFNTEAGFYINMVYSIFAFHFSRILFYYNVSMPVGVISDILTLATFLSLFIRRTNFKQSFNEFSSNRVVKFLLVLYAYFAIQLFNPNANSFFGWYTAFRKILGTLLLFIISYNVITSYAAVIKFIKYLFVLSLIVGIYGCIQEWHGVFEFERVWLFSDPHGVGLAFIGGDFRKFSTMSDPAAFSIDMAVCAVFFIALATGRDKRIPSMLLLASAGIMILSMSYSGTRTANAMLMAGLFLYILFTFHQARSRAFAIAGAVIFVIALYGPF